MKKLLFALLVACALPVAAHEPKSDHARETIAQHQAMAEAHAAAAQCLRSGKDEKTCHAELAAACKGLALGKRCGMRHAH
ncbi:MAG: hypothetical protein REI95_05275 [Oxalicibacterium faecigallinarum]|uniref:hypothetical protein n=1 Tax=Oxalicibacterium faecigallinarum TaxID=573741 RepID=UPI002807E881|nr:hypothetical protein [Oxalicibacterium faecigallinarum]MDQ7969036.1 hypothetical protein [Oxalicibacterium faecigallinarum]